MSDASPLLLAALRIGLTLLVLIAAAGVWIWRQRRHPAATRQMRVEDRLTVSRGVSLLLLQVEGQKLLVGVSAEGVRLVRNLGQVADRPALESQKSSSRNAGFADMLARATAGLR